MPTPAHLGPPRAWERSAVAWYLLYFGSQVSMQPFLTQWFARQGLSAQQLGLINAFRPWIGLPASFGWGAVADHFEAHRGVMLVCFAAAALIRCALLGVHTFPSILALVLLIQTLASPVGVLADAAVVATCKDNEYGSYRKYGAVGWGVQAFIAGAAIHAYGMEAGVVLHLVLSVPCVWMGWALHEPHAAQRAIARASATAARELRQAVREQRQLQRARLEVVAEGDEEEGLEEEEEAAGQRERRGRSMAGSQGGSRGALWAAEGGGQQDEAGRVQRGSSEGSESSEEEAAVRLMRWAPASVDGDSDGVRSDSSDPGELPAEGGAEGMSRVSFDGTWHASARSLPAPPWRQPASLAHEGSQGEEGNGGQEGDLELQALVVCPRDSHANPGTNGATRAQGPGRHEGGGAGVSSKAGGGSTGSHSGGAVGGGGSTHTHSSHRPSAWRPATRGWLGIRRLLSDPRVLLFLGTTCLLGYGFGLIDSFLFVFLQRNLGATELLMGLTLTITCAAEVPVFQVQAWLLTRFSVQTLLDVTLATYVLRMLCYAALPGLFGSAWAVLPVEVLHGVTFGLGWGVGTSYGKRLAPGPLRATMQGLFQGCYFGLGYGLGALVGGLISQRLGFVVMYVAGAGIMVGCWLVLAVARSFVARSSTGWSSVQYMPLHTNTTE